VCFAEDSNGVGGAAPELEARSSAPFRSTRAPDRAPTQPAGPSGIFQLTSRTNPCYFPIGTEKRFPMLFAFDRSFASPNVARLGEPREKRGDSAYSALQSRQ